MRSHSEALGARISTCEICGDIIQPFSQRRWSLRQLFQQKSDGTLGEGSKKVELGNGREGEEHEVTGRMVTMKVKKLSALRTKQNTPISTNLCPFSGLS